MAVSTGLRSTSSPVRVDSRLAFSDWQVEVLNQAYYVRFAILRQEAQCGFTPGDQIPGLL